MELGNFQERIKEAQVAPKRGSKRASIVKMFIDKINEERRGTKYPLIETPKQKQVMSIKLSKKRTGMSDGDLFAFYNECLYQKNFSSYFFWSTNPKKH